MTDTQHTTESEWRYRHEDFEEKHNVIVRMMTDDEICETYGITPDEIDSRVINNNGQTLPVEKLVIQRGGTPFIFHAKNPFMIENEFLNAAL
jgi:hypothetical protein